MQTTIGHIVYMKIRLNGSARRQTNHSQYTDRRRKKERKRDRDACISYMETVSKHI